MFSDRPYQKNNKEKNKKNKVDLYRVCGKTLSDPATDKDRTMHLLCSLLLLSSLLLLMNIYIESSINDPRASQGMMLVEG